MATPKEPWYRERDEANSPATGTSKSSIEAVGREAFAKSLRPSEGRQIEGLPSKANTRQSKERQTTAMETTPSQKRGNKIQSKDANVAGASAKRQRDSPERSSRRRRTQDRNFNEIITEIHSILSKEKLSVDRRSILHASLGHLSNMYIELQTTNTILQTENKMLKEQKPKYTCAQTVATTPTLPDQKNNRASTPS